MIIVCPECSARFAVKTEAIGAKGRKVKCAKCANTWFQKPDEEALKALEAAKPAEEPTETEPVPEGSNVPAVQKGAVPLYLKISAIAAAVLFLFITSLVTANSILPSMSGYYSLFGITDSSNILLYDVAVKKVESGKYQDLVISGKIVNESEDIRKMPDLRLTIYSAEKETLKTITLDSEGTIIEPGEKVPFENRIPRIPKLADTVVMDLGNSMDLASR